MRLMIVQILFIVSVFPSYGTDARGQDALNKKISISVTNTKLETVLEKIEGIVDAKFVFSPTIINVKRKLSFSIQDITVADFLKQILQPLGINYKAVDNLIILYDAKDNRPPEEIITNTDVIAKTITGKVTNSKGEPLQGVSVSVKGTARGTVTNAQGVFTIDAEEGETLEFSILGYVSATVRIGQGNSVAIQLQPAEVSTIDEVVVTALGIKKEARKLGYAASTVKVDEITQNRTTNVMKSLEGKVAGLEIAPPTAGAGASTRIRLRGQSGFAGQVNSPLIVINGLPMDQDARSAEGAPGIDQGDNLQQINQDDIESMTVLKGSTAAALYGSRASNGAIIIITKSGAKNSKFGVEFTSNFAADEVRDFSNFQTIYGTGIGGNRPTSQANAISSGNMSWGAKHDGVPTVQYDGVLRPYSADKNRIKEFYRTGTSFMNTIALSGGNASTSYRASFSNQDVTGITPDNSYHKKIFNLGLNSKVTDKLTLQVNINYTHEKNDNPPIVGVQGVSYTSFLTRMPLTLWNSTLKTSVVGPDGGALNIFNSLLVNPYFFIGRMFNYTTRDRLLGTVSVRYDFTKWLYLQGRVNVDFGYSNNEQNFPIGAGVPLRNSTNTGWSGTL